MNLFLMRLVYGYRDKNLIRIYFQNENSNKKRKFMNKPRKKQTEVA